MAWLKFYHTQSNIKKWHKKIKLTYMRFFVKKQLIEFSCTVLSFYRVKLIKKTWKHIQSYEDAIPFLFKNNQVALNKISLRKNKILISLLALFIVQNYKTIFSVGLELWGKMRHSEF